MAARPEYRHDLRRIGDELDTIGQLLSEKIVEAAQKLAENEAGSLG